ncbi:hypothetical protein TIFTF001_035487 [Ficus carica]|uniref:Uncharacterized protein n=1 Tax=Ficus carica TaxID=3494 RepID=A0AA88E4W3_FICCA|nr:hypothetical protein TIFTF001_035487 [Ficus carica]
MRFFDVRYAAMVVMNFLKPTPWEWDLPYLERSAVPNGWTKSNYFLVNSLLMILFSVTSMELCLCTNSALIIRFQLVGFSRHIALSLLVNGEPPPAAQAVFDISHGEEILPFSEVTDDIYLTGFEYTY